MFFKTSELLTVWHVFLSEPRMVSRKSWKSWIKAASLTWRKSKFQGKFHAENSEKKEMSRKPDVKRDTRFPRRRRQKCRKEPVLRKRRGNSYGQNEFSLRILTKLPPSRSISFLSGPMLQTCSKGLCHDEWHIMIKNEKDGKRWNMMKYDETWWNHWIYHILRGPGRNWSTACEESFSLTQSKHTVFQKKIVQYKVSSKLLRFYTQKHTVFSISNKGAQGSTREHNTHGWSQGSTFSNSSCTWGRVQSQLAEGQSLTTQRSLSWTSQTVSTWSLKENESKNFVLIVWVSMSQRQLFQLLELFRNFGPSRLTMKALFLWCLSWIIFNSL